jgi:ribosomal protein S6--L-glutamate ligase
MTLRLAILSRGPRLYSTRRLVEAAQRRGAAVEVLDPMKMSITVGTDIQRILNSGWEVDVDAVLPRIGYSITRHGVALVRQFERMGVYVGNSSQGILNSRDKLHATQLLTRNRVPVPTTAYVRNWKDVERAISQVGGIPVVIKVSEGTQGSGVFLARSLREARELTWELLDSGHNVLVQEYIAESHGKDVRVLVVGDQVVASMRRKAHGSEFRSNFHLNGSIEGVHLPKRYAKLARKAARLLGLEIAGVDLLESSRGPLLLEVNSSPGLEGIEAASGINVAGHIIDHVIESHAFSGVQLDTLLRSKPGHGVLSVAVRRHPELIGLKLSELFEGDPLQVIFAVARDGNHIWRPRASLRLQADDELICYGDLRSIRNLLRPAFHNSLHTSRRIELPAAFDEQLRDGQHS